MNFDEYQEETSETVVYSQKYAQGYVLLGLLSEAGEIAGVTKRSIRGDFRVEARLELLVGIEPPSEGQIRARAEELTLAALSKELGDLLWYIARLAAEYGLSLGEIAEENLKKLAARKAAGTLKGSGDDR